MKIGIKVFSKNIEAIKVIKQYYAQGLFDYIELMALPNSYKRCIKYWRQLNIPFVVHAPHGMFGFNLADKKSRKRNKKMLAETLRYADALEASWVIIHPGLAGRLAESISQIKAFRQKKRLVIENMPFISLLQTKCLGHSSEEIKKIINQAGLGFCLDVVHAAKAAFAEGEPYLDYLNNFLRLKPKMIHLCDCTLTGCYDQHLNLGQGEIDFKEVARLITKYTPQAWITLEVPDKSYIKFKAFKRDRLMLLKYFKRIKKS